ncbi:MAG TPA: lipocalin-like domain-containing protein [Planctomycetota bacterium]|nr:lipocalin-like domain-containing protein [Planctomycetota bacterium]
MIGSDIEEFSSAKWRLVFAVLLAFAVRINGEDFKQALAPRPFSFPADHASHAGYQTEWWYVTGNIKDEHNRAFGYQFTIFRRAVAPQSAMVRGRTSDWAADDHFLLHLAISDVDGQHYESAESLERGVLGLAGATDAASVAADAPPVRVWTKDSEFTRTKNGWTLKASAEKIAVDLELIETLPPVLHGLPGEEGLSRKGPNPGQASYYYSVPRLNTYGSLSIDGKTFKIVSGLSWMDHEFGSNQLSPDQAGWEWFSIHLDNGESLMLYVLRNKDGSIEPRSSGTWIGADGKAAHLALSDFELAPGRVWKSLRSGADYTVEWTLKIPSHHAVLHLRAAQDDQEFHSEKSAGMNYYEGAARIDGTLGERKISGEGYLEITGKTLGGRM